MRTKKSQGMPLNIIIIAAIAIIVLIVLVAIFSGKSKQFSQGSEEVSKGYKDVCKIPGVYGRECKSVADCGTAKGYVVEGDYDDCRQESNGVCCQL